MTDKPQFQQELEKLGWVFNEAADHPYQWQKDQGPMSRMLLGQDSPEWVQDVATAQVNILMKQKP